MTDTMIPPAVSDGKQYERRTEAMHFVVECEHPDCEFIELSGTAAEFAEDVREAQQHVLATGHAVAVRYRIEADFHAAV